MNKIIVFNSAFEQLDIISNWKLLSWTDAWCAEGVFELDINPNTGHGLYLVPGNILYLSDGRAGIMDGLAITKSGGRAQDKLTVTGYEIKDIVKKRITVPPASSGYDSYTNKLSEYIVAQLITKHLINPVDASRAVPGIVLGATHNYGSSLSYSTRYKALNDEIYAILALDGLGLRYSVDIGNHQISLYVAQGVDRTKNQNANSRAVFVLKQGTLSGYDQSCDYAAYKTMAYVGGQGEDVNREIVTIGGTNAGWARYETFVDARDVATTSELYIRGQAKLAEMNRSFGITAKVSDHCTLEFALGDYVTVYDELCGTWVDTQITQITETFTADAHKKRSITLGAQPMSIGDAVNLRLSALSNITTV